MAKKLRPDRTLFIATLTLMLLGVVMVFSSSAILAKERFGDPNHFSSKQLVFAGMGLLVMFVAMRIDYRRYRHPAVVFPALSVTVVLLVAVFLVDGSNNTHRWIQIWGLSFQPSELAKLVLIMFLAYFLEKRRDRMGDVRFTLFPVAVVTVLMAGLIVVEPDLGTALSLLMVAGIILFTAGLKWRWIVISVLAAIPVLYLLIFRVEYRRERILAFLDPASDPLGHGFQIIQSLISVGAGGISGLGYMEGRQKLFYLPEPHTDFIYAVIGEELGLAGTGSVLLLFLVFFWRGIRSSMRAPDLFGFYLGLGITVMISVQAFVNMSVVLGLMPTKGIPLPFLSYGGSSFLVMLASAGILLNVSQQGG